MIRFLLQKSIYVLLLPIFFVLHGFVENYDLIPGNAAVYLALIYISGASILTSFFWLIFRSLSKAAFLSFYVCCFFFFFGYIFDNIYKFHPNSFFSKYSTLIGAYSISFFILAVFIFRYKGKLTKLTLYLNLWLVLIIIVDIGRLTWIKVRSPENRKYAETLPFTICDTCSRPDIYLIVPDNYAGDIQLRETMNYNNTWFKNELKRKGFFTPTSNSNYNFTRFSIASMLQMDYLHNFKGSNSNPTDVANCSYLIRNNDVCEILSSHGYKIKNFSIFDVQNQPSIVRSTLLPKGTYFITSQTLLHRVEKNIIRNAASKFGKRFLTRRLLQIRNNNTKILDSLHFSILNNDPHPKFVYAHLVMPHAPYYFTKDGEERPLTEITDGKETDINKYVEYVEYTNHVLLNIVKLILDNSTRKSIIIIVSDHGFREYPRSVDSKYYFTNQLCVYMTNQNYTNFNNEISNVNLFRAIFNAQFAQNFPFLPNRTHLISH